MYHAICSLPNAILETRTRRMGLNVGLSAMKGRRNASCEETFRIWWKRYSEVEGAIRKLRVLDSSAEEPQATRSRSKPFGPIPYNDSNMALPFGTHYSTPGSPFHGQSHRHHSFGSLGSATQRRMQQLPSVEAFQTPSPSNSRSEPRTPDNPGRVGDRKGRSHAVPLPSTTSPTIGSEQEKKDKVQVDFMKHEKGYVVHKKVNEVSTACSSSETGSIVAGFCEWLADQSQNSDFLDRERTFRKILGERKINKLLIDSIISGLSTAQRAVLIDLLHTP